MKDYHRVLETQDLRIRKTIRHNKYIKIATYTQDNKLKGLIYNHLSRYDDDSFNILRKYCKNQIRLQIPTWQIAAKKAGWQSPSKQKKVILNLGK